MALSLGFSKSDSDSTFGENVYEAQAPYLADMWGQAGNLFNMGMPYFSPMMAGGYGLMTDIPQQMMPFWQNQMGGGVYSGLDTPGMFSEAFDYLGASPQYAQNLYSSIMGGEGNDYVDALGGRMRAESAKTLGENLSMLDRRAGLMMGGSPWEIATGKVVSESADDLDTRIAQLGYETFDKDLALKLDIARMADQNWLTAGKSRLDAASGAMAAEDMAAAGGLNFSGNLYGAGMSQFQLPFQTSMYWPQMIGQPIILGQGQSSAGSTGFGFGIG